MNTHETEIRKKFADIVPDGNYHRLGTVFSTTNCKYFYDTGTGKVYRCSDMEYQLLEKLLQNDKFLFDEKNEEINLETYKTYLTILSLIEKENILKAPKYEKFENETKEELTNLVEHGLQQVILELTQKCNLRCKYCIYNEYNPLYRNFENEDMTWEIAKKAIDYTYAHSGSEVAVTFYGGEPLIKIELMKQCIEYSQKLMQGKNLTFSFSTNLTLMTPEIAKYVASVKGCSVLCSLDGPENIHDSYRVFVDGKGTFAKAIQGLRYLVDAMEEKAKDLIIINTVVCPPYSKKKLDMIQEFFEQIEWLPKDMVKKCDYVEGGTLRDEDVATDFLQGVEETTDYKNNELDSIHSWALDKMFKDEDRKGYLSGVGRDNLIRIHNRILLDKPVNVIRRNACCTPGNRRIYVQTNGDFLACEKIGDSPNIGNVYTGIDKERIRQYYIHEYEEKSIKKCNECWAVNLCGICYASCYCKEGISSEMKDNGCIYQREQAKGELIAYHQLLEDKPIEIERIKGIPIY